MWRQNTDKVDEVNFGLNWASGSLIQRKNEICED